MTATHGVGTYGNAAGTVTPLDHKMAQLGDYVKTAANTIRAGLLWDGSATVVSGKANMSYDVRAFTAVLSRGATLGAVKLANDGAYNVATTAAPGSNSRYDVVYVWQREYSIDGTDSDPVIGVVQGSSAPSPTVPSLAAYPGAIELARILVPSGVTATNSGTTITQTAPFTAMSGGTIPFRSTTERDAGTYVEGQQGWLIDSDVLQVYSGSAWSTVVTSTGLIPIVPTSVAGTGVTLGANGEVTASASTTISMMGIGRADFDTIRIEWAGAGTAGANCTLRVRTGGSDISAANYNHLSIETNLSSGPTRASNTGDTAGGFARMDNGQGAGWLEITNLFKATATTWQGASVDASTTHRTVAGRHSLATSYPDLTILIGTGNFTGKFRVYGYNNN